MDITNKLDLFFMNYKMARNFIFYVYRQYSILYINEISFISGESLTIKTNIDI